MNMIHMVPKIGLERTFVVETVISEHALQDLVCERDDCKGFRTYVKPMEGRGVMFRLVLLGL